MFQYRGYMTISRNQMLEFAAQYGTPLYVYDGDEIINHYRELYDFIGHKKLQICYAMKANYNFHILKMLNSVGAALDTVSLGDVLLALRAGFPANKIIYTANNITDQEMDEVKATGVLFNIGSISELERFGKKFPGSDICLRFNPDVKDGDSDKTMTAGDLTKFGILMEEVDKTVEIVKNYQLRVVGLHEHTGSGIQNVDSVFQSMKNLMSLATRERFPDLLFLDFGGGFKVPYMPTERRVDYISMGAEICKLFNAFCKEYGRELKLVFEPGKYIVAEAGYLLTQVCCIKKNRERIIVGCDSGFPQLIRPVLYGAYHHITNLSNPDGPMKVYDICGNICETGDRFAEQRKVQEIHEGDILMIANAGAYCYSMGGVYNMRPMHAEVLVQEGFAELARKRLSPQELVDLIVDESTIPQD